MARTTYQPLINAIMQRNICKKESNITTLMINKYLENSVLGIVCDSNVNQMCVFVSLYFSANLGITIMYKIKLIEAVTYR